MGDAITLTSGELRKKDEIRYVVDTFCKSQLGSFPVDLVVSLRCDVRIPGGMTASPEAHAPLSHPEALCTPGILIQRPHVPWNYLIVLPDYH